MHNKMIDFMYEGKRTRGIIRAVLSSYRIFRVEVKDGSDVWISREDVVAIIHGGKF